MLSRNAMPDGKIKGKKVFEVLGERGFPKHLRQRIVDELFNKSVILERNKCNFIIKKVVYKKNSS